MPQNPADTTPLKISDTAVNLIKSFEGCAPNPEWPGGDSGITLGYGCDIGVDPKSLSAWQNYLSAGDLKRLEAVKGLTGQAARKALASVKSIAIHGDDAEAVFVDYTLPSEITTTLKYFPGSEKLPPDSFGALVSLVYNRGPGVEGERRTEMKAVRDALKAGSVSDEARAVEWPKVVVEIAKMVRLWPDKPTASNLSGRRLAEAALFALGLRSIGLMAGALIKSDKNDQVRDLQKKLGLGADGKFGTATMVGVWNFQGNHPGDVDLPATGVADRETLKVIGS